MQNSINSINKLSTRIDRIVRNEARQSILDSLGPLHPAPAKKMSLQLRQPGTGLWFLEGETFQKWFRADRAQLWMNGYPGVGKTVLTATALEEVEKTLSKQRALAYAFCDYKDSVSLELRSILGSLARQFAVQNEEAFGILEQFYKRHQSDGKLSTSWADQDLLNLIRATMCVYDHAYIVIDAVDEIGGNRAEVIAVLQSLNNPNTDNLKIMFTSRNEFDIQPLFAEYDQVSIAAQSSDLR